MYVLKHHNNLRASKFENLKFLERKLSSFKGSPIQGNYCDCYVADLHVPKKRFFLLILFEQFFYFLLTQGEKRAFSQLKTVISA